MYNNIIKVFQAFGNNSNNNLVVYMNDEEKQVRVKHEFSLGRSFNSELFSKILNYLNFRVTPELNKENFKYYCRGSSHKSSSEEEEVYDNDYQTLCIILFKQSNKFQHFLDLANKYR